MKNLHKPNGSTLGMPLAEAAALHPAGKPSAKAAQHPLLNSPTAQYQRQIRWLCRVIAGLVVGLGLSIYGNVFGSLRIVKYPFVIERSASGELVPVSTDPHQPVAVRPQDIKIAVRAVLMKVRRAGFDETMYGNEWAEAKTFLTRKTTSMMVPLISERLLWIRKGGTVDVQIISYLPVAGQEGKVVKVEWTETHVDKSGRLMHPNGEQTWEGTFKVAIVAADPTTKTNPGDLKNPLGIFVEDFTWTQKEQKERKP